jgi:hypothetical protein
MFSLGEDTEVRHAHVTRDLDRSPKKNGKEGNERRA